MENVERAFLQFRRETTAAYWSFFVWKSINNVASDNQQISDVIHSNHLTWRAILWSLQTTFHIALGRLFDGDSDTFSADKFLSFCIDNIDEFNSRSLRERKLAEQGSALSQSWLDAFMRDSYEPTIKDFQTLRGELRKRRNLYNKIYRPIRHKVYAHKEIDILENIDQLFSKTNIDDVEDFLGMMHRIETVVYHLLHNGKFNPAGQEFNIEQWVLGDVQSLLEKLKIELPG